MIDDRNVVVGRCSPREIGPVLRVQLPPSSDFYIK
nr:MAG TPA: hypothetical protein [Caudoviricetes sp.]